MNNKTTDSGKWGDLGPRVVSGLAMIAVGAVALWLGGYVFAALGVLIGGLAVWELVRMVRPAHEAAARQEAALAGFALAAAVFVPGGVAVIVLGLLLIVLIGRTGKYPVIVGGYTVLIFLGVYINNSVDTLLIFENVHIGVPLFDGSIVVPVDIYDGRLLEGKANVLLRILNVVAVEASAGSAVDHVGVEIDLSFIPDLEGLYVDVYFDGPFDFLSFVRSFNKST